MMGQGVMWGHAADQWEPEIGELYNHSEISPKSLDGHFT